MNAVLLLISIFAPAAQSEPARPDAPATSWDIRINPFLDLHFFIRSCAAGESATPDTPAFKKAVLAVRETSDELGSGLAWGLIESAIADCASAAEMLAAGQKLPESVPLPCGQSCRIRALTTRLARAYIKCEEQFTESIWPQHKAALEEARRALETGLLPKQAACFADVFARLGMKDPGLKIPVNLVARAPEPGAVTHRRRGGGGVCFVAVANLEGTLLFETVLHESLHAMDVATSKEDTAFGMLRRELAAAGMDPRSPAMRDVPHTLMFVQAAATIRQVIDRRHTDYGDARGYYAKVPQIAAPLRKAWKPYLDGTISRSEAIRRIVDATRDLNPTSRPRASMGRPRHRPEPGRCAPRPFFP